MIKWKENFYELRLLEGIASSEKLAKEARVSEEVAKLWLMKQAIWQIYLPALKHILRQTFDVKSPNATCQAEFLFLPHDKVTARLWKFYRYALTVVDVASRFKAAEPY